MAEAASQPLRQSDPETNIIKSISIYATHAGQFNKQLILVVQYAQISRHDFVLENSTRRYVNALTVVRYDDDSSLQNASIITITIITIIIIIIIYIINNNNSLNILDWLTLL